jgi:bifunctional DNase/RNase
MVLVTRLALIVTVLCACRSDRTKPVVLQSPVAGLVELLAEAEADAARSQRDKREISKDPPDGYLPVVPTARSHPSYGNMVLLTEPSSQKLVPIFIGGTEGLSIELRLANRKFTRPLTHDLLDSAFAKLGARLVRAQIDALKDGVYLGTIVLARGDETFALDARPSDAVALAIGNGAPIVISKKLLDQAGIALSELEQARSRPRAEPVAL